MEHQENEKFTPFCSSACFIRNRSDPPKYLPTTPLPLPYLGQLGNQFSTYPLLKSWALSSHSIKNQMPFALFFYVDPLLLPGCGLCLLNLFSPTNPQSLERWRFPSLLVLCPKNLVQLDSSSSGLSQHVLLFWLFWHFISWDSFL